MSEGRLRSISNNNLVLWFVLREDDRGGNSRAEAEYRRLRQCAACAGYETFTKLYKS